MEKKLTIDTNQFTANIGKAEKALDNATQSSNELNASIKETQETMKQPLPTQSIEEEGKAFEQAAQRAEQLKVSTDNVQKVSAGMQGSLQLAVGAIALMGSESEEVTKIMQQMSAVMVITDGLKKIGEGAAAMVALTKATKGAEKATKLFNLEILKNPYVIIAAAILAVVMAIVKLVDMYKEAQVEARNYAGSIDELNRKMEEQRDLQDFNIKKMEIEGKTQAEILKQKEKNAVDNYNMQAREYNRLLQLKKDADGDISEEEQQALDDLKAEVDKGMKEITKVRQEQELQKLRDQKEANKKAEEEEKAALEKRKELWRKATEDRKSITEELRRASLDEKALKYDDIELWSRQALEKAHNNAELIKKINEEKNRRIAALDAEYASQLKEIEDGITEAKMTAQEKELKGVEDWYDEVVKKAEGNADLLVKIEEEKQRRLKEIRETYANEEAAERLDNQSAENQYNLDNGEISAVEYDTTQLEIEKQRLALIEEGTAAYYAQLQVVTDLNKKLGEDQEQAIYDSASAFDKWKINSKKATDDFKKQWDKMDMGEQIGFVTDQMNAFGGALSNMFGAIMQNMDENSEAYKGLAITQTIIQTLVGMATALSGAFTTKSGPWDIALAAIQAASILAGGIATVSQIASANENTSLGSAEASITSGAKVSENAVQGVSQATTQSVPSVTPNSQMDIDTKTYVLTTDIQKKDKQLNNKKTEVKF